MNDENYKKNFALALLHWQNISEMEDFLQDVFSPNELAIASKRWAVWLELGRDPEGFVQKKIAKRIGLAPHTVGRVARVWNEGNGAAKKVARFHAMDST